MSNGYGYYKKLCTKHHKKKYNMANGIFQRKHIDVLSISKEPCIKCGWNKSFCDRHRIIEGKNGGKYTKDNTIPLCPNCHRVEHNKKSISDC